MDQQRLLLYPERFVYLPSKNENEFPAKNICQILSKSHWGKCYFWLNQEIFAFFVIDVSAMLFLEILIDKPRFYVFIKMPSTYPL